MGKKSRRSKTTSGNGKAEKGTSPPVRPPSNGSGAHSENETNNLHQHQHQPALQHLFGSSVDRPPLEPGRSAIVHGLVNRSDLNNKCVTIKKLLNNGRVAVEVTHLGGSDRQEREVVSIRPENLEVRFNVQNSSGSNNIGNDMKNWGREEQECPLCMDTMMNTAKNASIFECCGKAICRQCFVKTQFTPQRDVCPLCRADTSDTSEEASVRKVRARAERGDPNGMYNLAGYYDQGLLGVQQDQALARKWYKKAAEKGETRAAHNLACSYRDGEGGPVDKVMAAKYFRMAAEKGHVQATTCLGIALMGGDGVKKDIKEAKKLLKKSADAGDELAVQQLNIAEMMSSFGNMNMSFSTSQDATMLSLFGN